MLEKVLNILTSACSVQIISCVDSQSKFQMFTPMLQLHIGLCKFVYNISTNISSLGKYTDLKLGEVSLCSSYNVHHNFLTYPLNGFRIIFIA